MLPVVCDQAIETVKADGVNEVVLGDPALLLQLDAAVVDFALAPERQAVVAHECDALAH